MEDKQSQYCLDKNSTKSTTTCCISTMMSLLSLLLLLSIPSQVQSTPITATQAPQIIQHQLQQTQPQQLQPQQPKVSSGGPLLINLQPISLQLNPYTKATNELLLDLRQQMLVKSIKFDEHFRNLLSASKRSLHNMFADTYGMMYEHNTEIFTSMFESLEQYYANGQIKLTKSMENFFERLYQKIFQVFNQNRAFSPSYLECATEQLAHLKPFKDVPDKLIDEIRHAFVAARTFVQALNNGLDIIKSIISLGQPAQCTNLINEKLLKNTLIVPASSNPQQQGSVTRLPCLIFCEQVIAKCIGRGNLEQLNDKWRNYVVALNELANKLSTSYNIETIIAPLDVQISEAIMNFQENASNITSRVSDVCGRVTSGIEQLHLSNPLKPSSNRLGKRAAPSVAAIPAPISSNGGASSSRHSINNHRNQDRNQNNHRMSAFNQPNLAGLTLGGHLRVAAKDGFGASILPDDLTPISQKSVVINEIKDYMLSTKNFWNSLPNAVCTSNYTLGHSNVSSSAARHKQQQSPNCFHEPFGLADINSDLRYRIEIHHQVSRLDLMRSKIDSALAGIEIDWGSGGASEQLRPTIVAPSNAGGRLALPISTTTTTTTTTSAPELTEDEESEDEESDENNPERGSGNDPVDYPTPDDDSELMEPDGSTENPDPYSDDESLNGESTSEETVSTATGNLDDLSPTMQPNLKPEINQDNTIDQPMNQPSNMDDLQLNLITPPNQPDAQKSGQTSSKLVIGNDGHLLIMFLVSVTLLINTTSNYRYFQTNVVRQLTRTS